MRTTLPDHAVSAFGGSTAASTVVDLTRPAAGVTREGPVSARAIADALKAFDIPPERPSVNYGS